MDRDSAKGLKLWLGFYQGQCEHQDSSGGQTEFLSAEVCMTAWCWARYWVRFLVDALLRFDSTHGCRNVCSQNWPWKTRSQWQNTHFPFCGKAFIQTNKQNAWRLPSIMHVFNVQLGRMSLPTTVWTSLLVTWSLPIWKTTWKQTEAGTRMGGPLWIWSGTQLNHCGFQGKYRQRFRIVHEEI